MERTTVAGLGCLALLPKASSGEGFARGHVVRLKGTTPKSP